MCGIVSMSQVLNAVLAQAVSGLSYPGIYDAWERLYGCSIPLSDGVARAIDMAIALLG